MRPVEEWADPVFADGADVSHIKPFGTDHALCGEHQEVWFGTGAFDEFETALSLPVCPECTAQLRLTVKDPAVVVWEEVLGAVS